MRNLYKSLILLFMLILQSSLCGELRILGIAPQLLLCAVTAVALTSAGPVEAAIFGLCSGAVYDILWGRVFGVNALLMMYVSVAVFLVAAYIYRKTVISGVLLTFGAVFVFELTFYAVSFFLWERNNVIYYIFRFIIPSAAYTACFQFIIYPITEKLGGKNRRRVKGEV